MKVTEDRRKIMKKRITAILTAASLMVSSASLVLSVPFVHAEQSERQMEQLGRGLVAVKTSSGIYLSDRHA